MKPIEQLMRPEPPRGKDGRFKLNKKDFPYQKRYGQEILLTPKEQQEFTMVSGVIVSEPRKWAGIDPTDPVATQLLRMGSRLGGILFGVELRKYAYRGLVEGELKNLQTGIMEKANQLRKGERVTISGRYCESIFKGKEKDIFKRTLKIWEPEDAERR